MGIMYHVCKIMGIMYHRVLNNGYYILCLLIYVGITYVHCIPCLLNHGYSVSMSFESWPVPCLKLWVLHIMTVDSWVLHIMPAEYGI